MQLAVALRLQLSHFTAMPRLSAGVMARDGKAMVQMRSVRLHVNRRNVAWTVQADSAIDASRRVSISSRLCQFYILRTSLAKLSLIGPQHRSLRRGT